MINRVILVGRLTADPEIRYTQTGIAVASYRIAVDRAFKSANGEKQTDFINCVTWRKQAELMGEYVKKGYLVGVEGSLQMRKFQTKEGENRTVYEVVTDNISFLDRGGRGGGGAGAQDTSHYPSDQDAPVAYDDAPSGTSMPGAEPEDDLPF